MRPASVPAGASGRDCLLGRAVLSIDVPGCEGLDPRRTTSSASALAALLLLGPPPRAVALDVVSVVRRRGWVGAPGAAEVAFNAAQYVLSLAAAGSRRATRRREAAARPRWRATLARSPRLRRLPRCQPRPRRRRGGDPRARAVGRYLVSDLRFQLLAAGLRARAPPVVLASAEVIDGDRAAVPAAAARHLLRRAAGRRATPTARCTTRSRGCRTACCSHDRSSACSPAGRRAARADDRRPRRLQGRQRHARPRLRRPAAAGGRRAARRRPAPRRHARPPRRRRVRRAPPRRGRRTRASGSPSGSWARSTSPSCSTGWSSTCARASASPATPSTAATPTTCCAAPTSRSIARSPRSARWRSTRRPRTTTASTACCSRPSCGAASRPARSSSTTSRSSRSPAAPATGVEALARWQHPDLGRIGPDGFVPLADQAGLMGCSPTWSCARRSPSAAAGSTTASSCACRSTSPPAA